MSDEERQKYYAEGRCFRCSKQGHISRNCPDQKRSEKGTSGKKKARVAEAKTTAKIEEEDQDKVDDSDEEEPPKYEKGEAMIATIKAMKGKDRERVFEYLMEQDF